MRLFTFKFPHIPRLFSATLLFLVLWAGFGLLLAVNGLSLEAGSPATLYLPVLRRPLSADVHTKTAQALWNTGHRQQAKYEAGLAQDLSGGAVLGDVAPSDLLTQWESEPVKLNDQFLHWKKITEEKPDYRDAFVMAAVFAYQLGNKPEAVALINRAFALDPSPAIHELKNTIEENQQ